MSGTVVKNHISFKTAVRAYLCSGVVDWTFQLVYEDILKTQCEMIPRHVQYTRCGSKRSRALGDQSRDSTETAGKPVAICRNGWRNSLKIQWTKKLLPQVKTLDERGESRNNHQCAVVVQDLASQWLQSYPCKTNILREQKRVLEPTVKPKVTCSHKFLGVWQIL